MFLTSCDFVPYWRFPSFFASRYNIKGRPASTGRSFYLYACGDIK